jgi:hypothetical protein
MYQVQFISSGISAFSSNDRGQAKYWLECNNYGPDVPILDPDTGEVQGYSRGECLGLFKVVSTGTLKKVKQNGKEY